MEYTVSMLSRLSGVTPRTLRYYDSIGLLRPDRPHANGYRLYGREELKRLQQILLYRELGFPLDEIGRIIDSPGYDRRSALEAHLASLRLQRERVELLIANVTKTIDEMKGEKTMTDSERFEGLKKKAIADNEEKYGAEVRARFGDKSMDASNARLAGMSEAQWKDTQKLGERINNALREALKDGDPAGEKAQLACELHRQWLCRFWQEGAYSKQAHMALADGYLADERFSAYYNAIGDGGAKLLRDAIYIYCGK